MSKGTLTRLWIVTGLVALVLITATVALATRAHHANMQDKRAYVTSRDGSINVYEGPDRDSPVLVTLRNGSSVLVMDYATINGRTWYYVKRSGASAGWIPARNISLNRP
jgi:uncharacterized protein YgiM (DUF1202 family)